MKTLKELKIEMELARETYNQHLKTHLKTVEPHKRVYLKAIAAYDNALDAAIDIAWKSKKKDGK